MILIADASASIALATLELAGEAGERDEGAVAK